ncbi:hypothetical protein B4102_1325 [Heyndrickxia sporothermodurans]|uniref:Uncharacterized protein n=1 Tax=Heyndrickxia sporothermodurans TaxID=46224 RepID=A0A150L7G0_9BACI|nr:hypothetical protein B4102_1325 [Heyndrickxia sporothermodurans]
MERNDKKIIYLSEKGCNFGISVILFPTDTSNKKLIMKTISSFELPLFIDK